MGTFPRSFLSAYGIEAKFKAAFDFFASQLYFTLHLSIKTLIICLSFQRVRFHGIFDDDMSVILQGGDDTLIYSFFNVDSIYDFLLSIGMRPIVELR